MNKKEKDIYYCFRYKCKRCPKQRECEDKEYKLGVVDIEHHRNEHQRPERIHKQPKK